MRKNFIIFALTLASVLAVSADAFAQRRGGGGRGGGGRGYYGGGRSYYGGGRSYYGGGRSYYGGLGYSGYYGGYYGRPYYYGGYYYPSVGSYYYPSASYSYPSDYSFSDTYYAPESAIQQSYYPPSSSTQQQYATVRVAVPNPSAQIWFNGNLTTQQGTERSYYTPPLDSGSYSYTVKARWMDNGKAVERERTVTVQPGQTMSVNFRADTGESLPLPKRPN